MKKMLAVALTLFTLFMSFVFVGGFLQKQQKESSVRPPAATSSSQASPATTAAMFTINEVSNHNTVDDCWLIINNNVYSVSKFLGEHPGGASTITPYCGKEATAAFDTQDRGSRGGHSSQANQMLADYLVGHIKTP